MLRGEPVAGQADGHFEGVGAVVVVAEWETRGAGHEALRAAGARLESQLPLRTSSGPSRRMRTSLLVVFSSGSIGIAAALARRRRRRTRRRRAPGTGWFRCPSTSGGSGGSARRRRRRFAAWGGGRGRLRRTARRADRRRAARTPSRRRRARRRLCWGRARSRGVAGRRGHSSNQIGRSKYSSGHSQSSGLIGDVLLFALEGGAAAFDAHAHERVEVFFVGPEQLGAVRPSRRGGSS